MQSPPLLTNHGQVRNFPAMTLFSQLHANIVTTVPATAFHTYRSEILQSLRKLAWKDEIIQNSPVSRKIKLPWKNRKMYT